MADPNHMVGERCECHVTDRWLRFYEENFPPNMKESHYTYSWIKDCWGEAEAEKLASAVIVCSGATMGTPAGVQHYTSVMLNEIPKFKTGECTIHDQSFHNYLLYTGKFERVRLLRAGQAEVVKYSWLHSQRVYE
eukprot:m.1432627 g.1432627  ORF g.1432627 m.1432627 type:complete len:135 (+) comp25077_c0_seq36:1286-1690(+)